MDMKKWILSGAGIAALAMVAACSGDNPAESGEDQPTESSANQDPTLSSGGTAPGSSGGATPQSSSSIPDNAETQMGCSEIMYNAADGSTLEWVEIYIAGGKDMDNMQNFLLHLSGAVDYTFPAEPLKKGEYIVVANDLAKFKEAYPGFTGRLFGPWENASTVKLANEGDVVNVKVDGDGDVSCAFSNEPPWPSLADGKGRTLVYKGGNAAQPNSWAASKTPNGNPGVGNDEWITPATVRINEIMPNVNGENAWIELYNMGTEAVDVAGWTLQIKRRKQTLTIKSGTVSSVIPAKGYVKLDAVDNFENPEDPEHSELVVSPQGGEFYLRGPLEGEESSIWVPANTGTSGVVDLSDGSTAQGPLATATPGEPNSALQIGSVYINEIHYHPDENGEIPFEFMELYNNSDKDILLYSGSVSKGWKVEGVNLEFSNTTTLAAHALMLLIPSQLDPMVMASVGFSEWNADFVRRTYSIPNEVPIVTYNGKLSNRSETIAVKEPFAKDGDGVNASFFFIWHDATLYSDSWSGLEEADGFGYSLQRVTTTTMGYEASAWKAAAPTIGKK